MTIKPLFLLADSQLLFRQGDATSLTRRIRAELPSTDPKAAYIGAANNDNVEFYHLFVAAMESMGVPKRRMVPALLADEDKAFLEEADLFLLAGGDVERGWRVFEQNGLRELIFRKQREGSTLVGISAGAIQLGLGSLTIASRPRPFNLFRFAPFYVSTHAEQDEWFDLRVLVNLAQPGARGVGIPAGGGAIYWPDGTLEPVRRSLTELVKTHNDVRESLLLPFSASRRT